MTLKELQIGKSAVIKSVGSHGALDVYKRQEDNNLTGYGVTSDHAKGINKSTKEAGLLATAETLHEKYLTSGGSYYVGTSAAAVNKHYCVGGEWAAAVVKNAYLLMNRL